MMNNEIDGGVIYEAYDQAKKHPILFIQGAFGRRGWYINKDKGELTRKCVCYAQSSEECVCGAWDLIES